MSHELVQKLDEIKQQDDQLNRISDLAAGLVKITEDTLQKTGIGDCHAFYLFEGGRLEWQRFGNKFRIIVRVGNDMGGTEARPWSDCKRDVKLSTFQHIPGLLQVMAQNAEQMVRKAEETVLPTVKILREALDATPPRPQDQSQRPRQSPRPDTSRRKPV